MLDIEKIVFNRIANKVRETYPDMKMYGEERPTPAEFPCVNLYEFDNYTLERTMDSSSYENHAVVTFECNIFSNLQSGKKSQCKDIAKIIDTEFCRMGFRRQMKTELAINDGTIMRLLLRYRATVSKDNEIYRG